MSFEQAEPDGLMASWDRSAELSWDAIYASHLARVYNYFRFRFGSDADAEDLTARTFEKAWKHRKRYRRDVASFSTWLFQIAHNVGVDHLRSRRDHLPIDAADEAPCEHTPETDAERASDLARLAQLQARLSERERELIALKYGAGVNNRLIARLTGMSESNVGTILHRAVTTLREKW